MLGTWVTYTGTVHSIINAAKLLHYHIDHGLDTGLVGDIHLDGKRLEVCMLGVFLTFLRSLLGALLVQISKRNALCAGLRKRKSSFFADSGCGL